MIAEKKSLLPLSSKPNKKQWICSINSMEYEITVFESLTCDIRHAIDPKLIKKNISKFFGMLIEMMLEENETPLITSIPITRQFYDLIIEANSNPDTENNPEVFKIYDRKITEYLVEKLKINMKKQ